MHSPGIARRLLGWLPVVALGAAITAFIRHEAYPRKVQAAPPPTILKNSKDYVVGHWLVPGPARVTIVEFSDFQCPYCKVFHGISKKIAAKYPGQVAIMFRHYPLEGLHPYALKAAVASECAANVGHFGQFVDEAFRSQDSLGRAAWTELAWRSGIVDTLNFRSCLSSAAVREAINRDRVAGTGLRIMATPTVLINERLFSRALSLAELDSLVGHLLGPRSSVVSQK